MTTSSIAKQDLRLPRATAAVHVVHTVVGHRTVLTVSGEIDLDSAPHVAVAIDEALETGAIELWLDFSPTRFMDSTGLHLLLDTQMRLASLGRRLAVICPAGPVRRLLEVAGVAGRLPIFHDRAAAHRAA